MDTSTAITIGLVLLLGMFAWWSGRHFLKSLEHPTLAERLQTRNQRVTQLAIAVIALVLIFARQHAGWAVPAVVLAVAVASFPARRRLLDEQWSLGHYLLFHVRLWAGWFGVWLLLLAAPFVVHATGAARPLTAAVLAALLVGWNAAYSRMFVRLVGARPMVWPAHFAAIVARAKIKPPRLFQFGVRAGRFVNAFALPSIRTPGVVLSAALLDALDADEQAAIFAHEIAHLESFSLRRLVASNAVMLVLIALATGGALLVPEAYWTWVALWPAIVIVVLAAALTRLKGHEEASDRRAVELCGNQDAFVRALIKITALARMPRRWGLDFERGASHPSLARRIQAIRRIASTGAAQAPMQVVATRAPGTYVIFEADRAAWLDGVPAGTPPDAVALRSAAASYRSVRYDELVELRVRAGMTGAPALLATDRSGKTWAVPLRDEAVGIVQAALDAVDEKLARPGRPVSATRLGRAVAVLLMVLNAVTGPWVTPLVAGLLGFIRPSRAMLAACAAAAIGAAAAALVIRWPLRTDLGSSPWVWLHAGMIAGLLAVGVVSAWLVFRPRRGAVEGRMDVFLPAGGMGLLTVGVVLGYRALATSFGLAVVDNLGPTMADIWMAPLAWATSLLAVRHRAARYAGIVILVASLIVYARIA